MREVKHLLASRATYGEVLNRYQVGSIGDAALRQFTHFWKWSTFRYSAVYRVHARLSVVQRINRVRRVLGLQPYSTAA